MAKRKRGRKPLKAGVAKSKSLTMRLHPDMRRALEASARATGRTISVAAERLLHAGLTDIPDDPADGHLVSAIALLIKRITKDTQRSWAKDGYTAQSIRHAIDGLLFQYAATPDASPPAPEAIERRIAKMPPKLAERYRDPEYFGHMHSQHLIREFQEAQSTKPPTEISQPYFFYGDPGRLSVIGRELEKAVIDINRKGKSK